MIRHNVRVGYNEKDDCYLRFEDRLNNSICIGTTGSGKYSQLIKPMLNQDIMNDNLPIITIDANQDMSKDVYGLAKHYNRKIVVFDPVLKNKTVKFNPLIGNIDDCKYILLNSLNSQGELTNSDDFYNKFLGDCLYIVKNIYGNEANLLDLYYLISNYNNKGVKMIKDYLKKNINKNSFKKDILIANWFINVYYKDLSDFSKSILLREKLEKLLANEFAKNCLVLERNCENVIDTETLIKNKEVLAISTAYEYLKDIGPFLANMLFAYIENCLTTSTLLNKEDSVALYIYEPQTLSIDILSSILDKKTKINLYTMLSVQDIEVFSEQLSIDSVQSCILEKCSNSFIFPGVSKNTANYYLSLMNNEENEINCIDNIVFMKFGEMLLVQKKDNTYCEKIKIRYIPRFLDECLVENYSMYFS